MPVTYRGGGFVSTPFGKGGRPGTSPFSGGGRGSRGGQSTVEQPTPSAGELFGTPEQREAQIAAFRSGGRGAFEASVAQARQQALQQAQQQAEQQRQAQLTSQRYQYLKQTRTDVGAVQFNAKVQAQPYVEARQTGTFTSTSDGKKVPTREYVYVDPYGKSLNGGAYVSTERPATEEEISQFRTGERALSIEGGTAGFGSAPGTIGQFTRSVQDQYSILNWNLQEGITLPIERGVTITTGQTPEQLIAKGVQYNVLGVPFTSQRTKEFQTGLFTGIYQDIRDKPLKNIALFGAGKVVGIGVAGVGTAISSIPKVGATAGKIYKGAEVGAGVYLTAGYVGEVYSKVSVAGSYQEKGSVLGVSLKDASLLGFGYSSGTKNYQQIQGLIRTAGRTEIPAEQILTKDILSGRKKFVESPTGKIDAREYLNLFQTKSQVIPGMKEPMAYHSTPSVFYGKTLEVTSPGTSEFPGLYGAYRPSPYFTKVGSTTSGLKVSIKSILQPYGRPGTAGIIPTKFVIGKSAKPGQAFIPGTKPEVEAIFPVGTKANLLSSQYYYSWKGVRIPLDVYKATGGKGKSFEATLRSGSYSSDVGTGTKFLFKSSSKETSYSSPSVSLSSITSSSIRKSYGGSSARSPKTSGVSVSQISSIKSGGYSSRPSKKSSVIIPSYVYRGGGGSSIINPPTRIPTPTITGSGKIKSKPPKQSSRGTFSVEVRRRGKFRSIGSGLNLKQALSLGKQRTSGTLAASFRIKGYNAQYGVPQGYRRSKREAGVLVELPKYRLSKRTEVSEIQSAKRRKELSLLS